MKSKPNADAEREKRDRKFRLPECPACGATGDMYEGDLMECPHCGEKKCSMCDMGNDTSCLRCEGQ